MTFFCIVKFLLFLLYFCLILIFFLNENVFFLFTLKCSMIFHEFENLKSANKWISCCKLWFNMTACVYVDLQCRIKKEEDFLEEVRSKYIKPGIFLMYKQAWIKRSYLGKQKRWHNMKCDLWKTGSSHTNFNRTRTCDLIIKVTAWQGLTVIGIQNINPPH